LNIHSVDSVTLSQVCFSQLQIIESGNENSDLGTGIFVHKRIISSVNRVEFVSDRMSYVILRGCWCDIIVLNVHAPTEDKIYDMKDRF
jgi:hypothetical protein